VCVCGVCVCVCMCVCVVCLCVYINLICNSFMSDYSEMVKFFKG
jgi:hypothetical protein